jgi:hypothetical protein
MTAVVKDGDDVTLATTYYRYNKTGSFGHGLKFEFSPASYEQLVSALGTELSSLTDTQVAPFADKAFAYDDQRRVVSETVQGAGASGEGGGLGTFSYAYTNSGNDAGFNNWSVRTEETLPDGSKNTVYTNAYGQVLLKVFTDSESEQSWISYYRYNDSGRLVLEASPSAVIGYDDSYSDLLHDDGDYEYLSNDSGLITVYDYYTSTTATETTAGSVAGYQQSLSVQQGEEGTPILQSETEYFSRSCGGSTIYPVATETRYRNDDGTGAQTTSYSYTWHSGTVQMASLTVTKPVVSSQQNGPGTADVEITVFDSAGRTTWYKNAGGFFWRPAGNNLPVPASGGCKSPGESPGVRGRLFPAGRLTYTAYDETSGAVVKTIVDVDTTQTSDFSDLPSGWSTPSGGGLHLKIEYVVDDQGRTTEMIDPESRHSYMIYDIQSCIIEYTDPDGLVTFTFYDDTAREVRVYPKWNTTMATPGGPTQVSRTDLANGYSETLTMTAEPHLTYGVPDGTEEIDDLQSLYRTFTNAAGQVVEQDVYFELDGLSYSTDPYLGTVNTNYYATLYGYGVTGQQDRVEQPTGTIVVRFHQEVSHSFHSHQPLLRLLTATTAS